MWVWWCLRECRARALVLNGSINAPDPWIIESDALRRQTGPNAVRDPLDILELTREAP